MSVIHETKITPTELELLSSWLPSRPWYRGTAKPARLSGAGGFRLDDPQGNVGIEFLVVTDSADDTPVTYLVPLTLRDAPLDDADDLLIGTAARDTLGQRWAYDGVYDPVLVHQLIALVQGNAKLVPLGEGETPQPAVRRRSATIAHLALGGFTVEDGPDGTYLEVTAGFAGDLTVHIPRVLSATADPEQERGIDGYVCAPWSLPDGGTTHSIFATAAML